MTITLRNVKGSPLTYDEMDNNFIELSTDVHGVFSHLQNFTIALPNTPTPIPFDTNNELSNIIHNTTTNNSEFTIEYAGVYQLTIEPQLERLTGAGGGEKILNVWIQKDVGAGFVNLPDSNIKRTAGDVGSTGISPLTTSISLNVSDKIRFMAAVTDVNLRLQYTAEDLVVGIPATPAVILNIVRIGV